MKQLTEGNGPLGGLPFSGGCYVKTLGRDQEAGKERGKACCRENTLETSVSSPGGGGIIISEGNQRPQAGSRGEESIRQGDERR